MKNGIKLFGTIALVVVIGFSIAACKAKTDGSSGSAAVSAQAAAPAASSTPSLNKIDGLIADYEKFLDDYAAIVKKMMAGDASAQADAEKFGAQMEDWTARWEGVSASDFTPAQKIKMEELAAKMQSVFGF